MVYPNDIDAAHIEQARADYAWILPTVHQSGSLWHRTSIDSFREILQSGAILPSDGRFAPTYPQSNSCYGRHIGAVCLFDFDSEPLNQILLHAIKWGPFFAGPWRCDGGYKN